MAKGLKMAASFPALAAVVAAAIVAASLAEDRQYSDLSYNSLAGYSAHRSLSGSSAIKLLRQNDRVSFSAPPANSLDENRADASRRLGSGHHITWGRANTKDAYFDDMTRTNITAVVGQTARLPCRVINLGQKDVTWIRKRDIHILTLGVSTYTSDARFTVVHNKKTKEWVLQISPVTFRDVGVYECQVSTSPKISLPVTLNVEVQQARIQGPTEVYIQNGSTISLTCIVNTHSENVGAVTWFRDAHSLDYDSPRGGVSLEIEKTPTRTTSKLFITRAIKGDSGNYTCAPEFADAAFVSVHVVNGEESAAVQTGGAPCAGVSASLVLAPVFALLLVVGAGAR